MAEVLLNHDLAARCARCPPAPDRSQGGDGAIAALKAAGLNTDGCTRRTSMR